ncbi:MAG TPA: hypothetical protein VE978_12390 [Chitinophagales bacterium]|nr:hypothetical protein [Chitinophagales bacterium]
MENFSIPLVPKEKLHHYHFLNREVLETGIKVDDRRRLLDEAMLLGNGEKQKVKMIFETTEGPIMVETTVWDATDSHVELKGATDIPICCIREVII